MVSQGFMFDGAKFVPNNFDARFEKIGVPAEFHAIQDCLSVSEIGFSLTNPDIISARAVLQVWRTGV